MEDTIKLKLTPHYDMYPKTTTDFRIYSCRTNDDVPVQVDEQYGTFVVKGVMAELIIGQEYEAEIQEVFDPKYGVGYNLISIKQDIPKTAKGQFLFLRSIVAKSYVDTIEEIHWNNDNIIDMIANGTLDYSNLKGIGEIVFKEHIQKPVLENLEIQDALIELTPLGVTNTIIKKLIAHYGGNVALTIDKVKKNIYILCEEVSGIGFKKVDEYALKSGVESESPYRINACIEYLLGQEEGNGHCWVEKDSLIEKVMDETDLEYKIISDHLKSKEFIDVKGFGSNKKFYVDEWRVGLQKNYYYESKIAEYLFELMESKSSVKVENIDEKIERMEEEQGFEYTDEQRKGIMTAIENNVVVISGRAGSGKTSILLGILGILKEYGTYETCSLSGKASQRIIEATGLTSKTIHRMLGFNPSGGFAYDRKNRLPVDIVALDEASMVDGFIFYKLVSAIKEGGKLIILGDDQQLPPIGTANVFRDMIDSGIIPLVELTKVHRQAQKSGILSYANKVRDGIQINDRGDFETKTVGELQDLVLMPFDRKPDIASHIISICERVKDRIDLSEFQIIVPMKERGSLSTRALNLELQPLFNDSPEKGLLRNGYEYKKDDKIIKRGNDYDNNIYNGTLGYIIQVNLEHKYGEFKFVSKEDFVEYSQEDMKDIDMAYALTVHSNQGSQYENGICALDFGAYVLLSRQLVYTMLTRFSKKCMFLFENEALRYAIDNDASVQRNTFLPELLVERYKMSEKLKVK